MPSRLKDSTLVILLGASRFPNAPSLRSSTAFLNAYQAVRQYYLDPQGFGLSDPGRLFERFDSDLAPSTLCKEIAAWLRRHVGPDAAMTDPPASFSDLHVYYVGHGGFGRGDAYYLALNSTEQYDPYTHSLQIHSLATLLRTYAATLRRFVIIDACFAAAAPENFQSPLADVVKQKVNAAQWSEGDNTPSEHPAAKRGTSMLCASSSTEAAIFGPESTRFSAALIEVLRAGDAGLGKELTLRDVRECVARRMNSLHGGEAVNPEIHSPDQRGGGDIADDGLFPNPAAVTTVNAGPCSLVRTLHGHHNHIDDAAWSADGSRIASGSYDNTIRIWDVLSGRIVRMIGGFGKGISSVAWDSRGERVLAACYDGALSMFRVSDCLRLHRWESPRLFPGALLAADWSRNDRIVATGGKDGQLRVYDASTGRPFEPWKLNEGWINALAFDPQTSHLAIALGGGLAILEPIASVRREMRFAAFGTYCNAVTWIGQTNTLATGGGDGLVQIWDANDGELKMLHALDEHEDKIVRVVASPDGRRLASIGQDRLVVWSCGTWTPLHVMYGPYPTSTFLPLAFSPDGLSLVAADPENPAAMQLLATQP